MAGLPRDSVLSKYFFPFGFGLSGATVYVFSNYYLKRPFYSSMHKIVASAIAGVVLGFYAQKFQDKRFAHRDAIIKHYVELHPEDFVEEKRQYKEIFEEWPPIR